MMKQGIWKSLKRDRKEWLFFLLVLVLVVLRAAIYRNFLAGWKACFFSDSAAYAILARRLWEGDFWGAIHPIWNPGLPVANALFYAVTGSWEKAQVAVSMVSATALILVMWWFLKRWSLVLALAAAFVTAFAMSLQILVVREGITEPLYLLFLWLAIAFGWLALSKGNLKFYGLCGAGFALGFLVRTDVMGILAGFVMIIGVKLIVMWLRRGRGRAVKMELVRLGVFLGTFFLVILPYVIVISMQLGRFTLSAKYALLVSPPPFALEKDRLSTVYQDVDSVDFLNKNSPYFDPVRVRQSFVKEVKSGSAAYFAKKSWGEIWLRYEEIFNEDLFGKVSMTLAAAGLVLGVVKRKMRGVSLYLGWLFLVGLVWVAVFMSSNFRYISFAFPFFYVAQAVGIWVGGLVVVKVLSFLLPFVGKWIGREEVVGLVAVSLLVGFLVKSGGTKAVITILTTGTETYRHCNYKVIGGWLKSQNINLVGTMVEAIGFYSGARYVYRPAAPPDEIVRYMKGWGVEYVVMTQNEIGYEMVRPFADPKFKHPDLTLMKWFNEDGSLVWKVRLTDEERKVNERTKLGFD